MQVVLSLIEEDLRQVPKPSQLARVVNLSPSRFNHLFKTEIGTSPLQYLKVLRMERAKVLLTNTFLSVKEIMASVGVNDPSHFVREFKKNCGLTPSQYRRTHTDTARIKDNFAALSKPLT